jgi:hypothetical protein
MSGVVWQPVLDALDDAAGSGFAITLWWRDDDAVTDTAALQRLVSVAKRFRIDCLLAVIPAFADGTLAAAVRASSHLFVCQHGFAHQNHARPGEKKIELADHRGVDAVLAELAEGTRKLDALDFGGRYLPVLVPPWNRIGPEMIVRLQEAGFPILSVFGREGGSGEVSTSQAPVTPVPGRLNTHIDLVDWRAGRVAKTERQLADEIARDIPRALADDGRIGLLTHHLVHDDAMWGALETMLRALLDHPAVNRGRPGEMVIARNESMPSPD